MIRAFALISAVCLLLGCATERLPLANDAQCGVVRAAIRDDVDHTFGYALDPNRFELTDRPLLVVGEDQAFAKFREFGLSEPIASSLAGEIAARHLVPLRVRCEAVRWTRRNEFGVTIWDAPIFLDAGRYAYIEYGTAWAPLAYEARACLFVQNGSDWRRVGCTTTEVS